METYTIYHVLTIKVGCTEDFIRRSYENKRTYGKDIIVVILEVTTDLDLADELENKWSIELGYGEIPQCFRYKARNNWGKSQTGKITSLETKEKIRKGNIGKLVSLETREKMSQAQTGKITSLETREKISKASKGKSSTKGKRWGKVYIEHTTGYIGAYTDTAGKFKIFPPSLAIFAKRNKPISRGPHKGLHFAIYSKDI